MQKKFIIGLIATAFTISNAQSITEPETVLRSALDCNKYNDVKSIQTALNTLAKPVQDKSVKPSVPRYFDYTLSKPFKYGNLEIVKFSTFENGGEFRATFKNYMTHKQALALLPKTNILKTHKKEYKDVNTYYWLSTIKQPYQQLYIVLEPMQGELILTCAYGKDLPI